MKHLISLTLAVLLTATASLANTYVIDRAFDGATVTGTITTNGDLGFITEASLVSWNLRITSPTPLWGGVGLEDRLVSGTPNAQAILINVNAFEDHMIVDLINGGAIGFAGGASNRWVIASPNSGFDTSIAAEYIGNGDAEGAATAFVEHRGRVFFGRVTADQPCRQVNCGIPGR